jgi:hypothetical protein
MFPQPRIVPSVIFGQGLFLSGHVVFARFHIVDWAFSGQFISMCSMSSMLSWQWVHLARILRVGMFDQYSPIQWAPCSDLKMNCFIFLGMSLFSLPFQMLSSVSNCPVIFWIANLAMSRKFLVICLSDFFVCSLIPLYARAWVMVANFTPCRLNSFGIVKSMLSSVSLFAPSLARWSACSFPCRPLCPFTQMKPVWAKCFLRWYAVALRGVLFVMPIQPASSHVGRYFVRLLIAYFESVMNVIGM